MIPGSHLKMAGGGESGLLFGLFRRTFSTRAICPYLLAAWLGKAVFYKQQVWVPYLPIIDYRWKIYKNVYSSMFTVVKNCTNVTPVSVSSH